MQKTRTLSLSHIYSQNHKLLVYLLIAAVVSTFFLYIYLVNKTIMNVVTRERAQSNISSLSTTLGSLEFKYITLKNGVTLDVAHEKGFQDASPTAFLARKTGGPLTYNSSH
jgi:hypothetical protein